MGQLKLSSVQQATRGATISPRYGRARLSTVLVLLIVVGAACGCTSLRQWWRNGAKVGPNYARPPAPVAPSWVDSADPRVISEPAADCSWWTVFNDATLNGMIEQARAQNLDLRAAGTRILEARAQRGIAVGNLFPQKQTAIGTYVHGQITDNLGIPLPTSVSLWATGFNASWELDFWGRYRRAIEGSTAEVDAAIEGYGESLVMLLGQVSSSYVQLRTFEQRLDFARRNVEIQRGSTQLAEQRFKNGAATELDVRQARTNLAQTEALIPPLVAGRRQAANQLCVLLGMPVTDLASSLEPAPIPRAPAEVAIGIPADLLRRRPDVRRAEREVAAQSAQIGIAEADLYPRLAVNGFIGYVSNDFRTLFRTDSFTSFVMPSLQWNILNYGRIANNIIAQDVRLQREALEYQQAVLNAGREVEDSLIAFLQSQQQAEALRQSVFEAGRAVDLVLLQYEGGVTDFNRVFNAQSTLVTLQDQLAQTQGDIALRLIDVYRSLGGGWRYFVAGQMPLPAAQGPAAGDGGAAGADKQPPIGLPAEEVPAQPSQPGPVINGPVSDAEKKSS
jgi:NodT family efflux transporter outer membrane factor (OMF) lipoprotein